MAAEDSDRIAKATGGAVAAPEVGAIAQALGVSSDVASFLAQEGGAARLLPTDTVLQIGQHSAGVLGVCQVAVNVYQNKQVQWGDVAGLAATAGSWAEVIPPPYGSLAQMSIVTAQAVQANHQAGRDLDYEVAVDYYHGAGGNFARQYDPSVTQGGALADQFIENQLDPRTRRADFSAAFAEYCERRYHNDNVPVLIAQIEERRQEGDAPIPGALRGLARRFLDDQKGVYHMNNEIVRMRAFVAQNLTKIRALSELAQRLRDDPEFIERYKRFYREQTGKGVEGDEGGPNKSFRVHLVSGYDDRPLPFRSVMITSSETALTTNEQGLTPYWQVGRELESILVVATAPDHEGSSRPIPLGGEGRQTVELKLEPSDVELVVRVTSGGQPVGDATVRMLGPSGRLQVQAAPGGRPRSRFAPARGRRR